jgi:hypothetical protein
MLRGGAWPPPADLPRIEAACELSCLQVHRLTFHRPRDGTASQYSSKFTSADRVNVSRSLPSAIAQVQDKTFLQPAFQCDRVSIFDSASQAIIAASRWLTTAGSPAYPAKALSSTIIHLISFFSWLSEMLCRLKSARIFNSSSSEIKVFLPMENPF